MNRRVELTHRAERDVDGIVSWISKRSLSGAVSWLDRFDEVIAYLAVSAESASRAPEDGYGDVELRQFTFKTRYGKPYRVIFTIGEQVVIVRHVRGPGQDLVPTENL